MDLTFASDGGTERMRIDSSGNVGIGSASPTVPLEVNGDVKLGATNPVQISTNVMHGTSGSDGFYVRTAVSSAANPTFSNIDDTNTGMFFPAADNVGFTTAGSERMRLSSAGTFLIGKTAEGTATDGIELNRNDVLVATRDGDAPLLLNRRSSDGDIALLRKDNANVGSIGVSGGNNIYISGSQTNHAGLTFATDAVLPTRQEVAIDNVTDLGASSERFSEGIAAFVR